MTALGNVNPGDVLGRYELLMPIARGGMATVWAARLKGSRGFQKIVAIKTILPDLIEDPRFNEMFLEEAKLASRIHHPHVVEIHDLGELDGVLYLVMEWVDGEPLSVVLKSATKTGGLPLPIAVRITSEACAGLHAAHELRDEGGDLLGLVHRDVSPQNLLITFEGVVKVVDFGVAKATGSASSTTAGQVKGKAAYMSPEQARGEVIDRRSDIFALGIALYSMSTGQHPFRGDNDAVTVQHICSRAPPDPPSRIVPGYPAALEAVVLKALAKDRHQRYATANDLLRDLDQALPEKDRVVTDEPVASFMRSLLEQRYEQRKCALKAAQHMADERAAGRAAGSLPVEFGSHTGFTPVSSTSAHPLRGQMLSSRPPGPPPATLELERTDVSTSSATDDTIIERASALPGRPRRRGWMVGGLVGVATIVGFLAAGRIPAPERPALSSAVTSGAEASSAGPLSAKPPNSFPVKVATAAGEGPNAMDAAAANARTASANDAPAGRGGAAAAATGRTSSRGSASSRLNPTRPQAYDNGRSRPPPISGAGDHDAGATFLSPVRTPGF